MEYSVEISLLDQAAAGSDEGLPRYRLSTNYTSITAAETAAQTHVAELDRCKGRVTWRILDGRSLEVGSSG